MKQLIVILSAPFNSLISNIVGVINIGAILKSLRIHSHRIKGTLDKRMFLFLAFRISHCKSRRFFFVVSHLGLLIGLLYSVHSQALEVKLITCLDKRAIIVPLSQPFGGAYVRCEDFDQFYSHLERGERSKAKALLLTPAKSKEPGKLKWKHRRENFYSCDPDVEEVKHPVGVDKV